MQNNGRIGVGASPERSQGNEFMTVFNEIKGVGARVLSDDTIFYSAVVGLVALVAFGLGRFSVDNQALGEGNSVRYGPATVIESTRNVSTGTSSGSTIDNEKVVTQSTDVLYVGSKNSDKYHLPWCSGAKRIAEANKVYFNSKAEAEAAGYSPAANCKGI